MVHNFLILSWALVFFSCANIKKKSNVLETSPSIVQAITDKTILYWKYSLDNVAKAVNKKNEIDEIKYEFEKQIKSNIKNTYYNLTESCHKQDLLLLDNLVNVSLELVRNNDSGKIGEAFSTLTKDIQQSCKETWFNWFITCEDTMKNLIYKYYTPTP
jgi:hypothetical protein